MRALITGICGQDAWYLSRLLVSKGYEAIGARRGNEEPAEEPPGVKVVFGDVADANSIREVVEEYRPQEIYNLAAITHGAAMVYPSPGFEPRAVLEAVQAERCTALYGVPTMFIAELEHPGLERFDLGSLRTGIMAGSPCPVEVMRKVVSRLQMPEVTICYGMTETSPVSFQTGPDDPIERRVGSVGRVHPHIEVKIIDGAGRIVAPGTPGELCTRGYSVMLGYWDDPVRTAEAVDAAGWMHSGDLATLDAEGYCNIVGRIKDMVIRGGEEGRIRPHDPHEYPRPLQPAQGHH